MEDARHQKAAHEWSPRGGHYAPDAHRPPRLRYASVGRRAEERLRLQPPASQAGVSLRSRTQQLTAWVSVLAPLVVEIDSSPTGVICADAVRLGVDVTYMPASTATGKKPTATPTETSSATMTRTPSPGPSPLPTATGFPTQTTTATPAPTVTPTATRKPSGGGGGCAVTPTGSDNPGLWQLACAFVFARSRRITRTD